MNFWDIIILLTIFVIVLFAVFKIVKRQKNGECCCGSDCSNCSCCTDTANKVKKVHYKDFTDDLVKTRDQNFSIPDSYFETDDNITEKLSSRLLYNIFKLYGILYCKFVLHLKIVNKDILKSEKNSGFFIFGNHTQPIGDVFIPALLCEKKHISTLASPANYSIFILGKLLRSLGAIPVASNLKQMKLMVETVHHRYTLKHAIVIYPEAHVWPYCTFIRPFPASAFRYAIKEDAPSFCITTTYQKRKIGKKPKTTVYVDGPFYPSKDGSIREKTEELKQTIYSCMSKRSKLNNYAYIQYEKEIDP